MLDGDEAEKGEAKTRQVDQRHVHRPGPLGNATPLLAARFRGL
jgi:hypothetical protein